MGWIPVHGSEARVEHPDDSAVQQASRSTHITAHGLSQVVGDTGTGRRDLCLKPLALTAESGQLLLHSQALLLSPQLRVSLLILPLLAQRVDVTPRKRKFLGQGHGHSAAGVGLLSGPAGMWGDRGVNCDQALGVLGV